MTAANDSSHSCVSIGSISAPFERAGIFVLGSFLIFIGIVDSAALIIFSVSGRTSSSFNSKQYRF